MNIIIRADSSTEIGSGHIMRTLTLAQNLKSRGANITYLCRNFDNNLFDLIKEQGFEVLEIPHDSQDEHETQENPNQHSHWLHTSQERDAKQCLEILQTINQDIDLTIIDHYALDHRWEELIKPYSKEIFVIDDLADRKHISDYLLDQNFFKNSQDRYNNLIPKHTKQFLGPRYALLREEFQLERKKTKKRNDPVKNVLVSFGGYDPYNITLKTIKAIQHFDTLQIKVVCSKHHPFFEEIESEIKKHKHIERIGPIQNMAEEMNSADLFIGAGGSTSWERMCLGLPALIIGFGYNQDLVSTPLAENGFQIYLGLHDQVTEKQISDATSTMITQPLLGRYFSRKGFSLVDGKGVKRLSEVLFPKKIEFRKATISDCEMVYNWRTAKETLETSFNLNTFSYTEHEDWFKKSIQSKKRELLIANYENTPIGILRFDLKNDFAITSIYLKPNTYNQGFGSIILQQGISWLKQQHKSIKIIKAKILKENIGSQRAFEKAGFHIKSYFYELNTD